jgi:V/A-type H+-transporting ATPase subunit C
MSLYGTASGGRSSNYEYVIARVRSRRASLFDDDDYRKLVRMGTSEIARFMEETEYETEMNALGARYSGSDLVEYALNRNLAKHFDDLLDWSEGALYDYIARYLRKFDAWNVKTVIRGLYSGAELSEIEVESLDDTIFGDSLAEAFEVYEAEGVLIPLENAVDRAFYGTLLDGLPSNPERDSATGLYVQFLQAEVDFRNLRNALRLARSGADVDPAEYYIAGGKLFDEQSLAQLTANMDGLVAAVRESTYGDDLDSALSELEDAGTLVEFERALDAALLEYADTLSTRYPLSVCPVLSYILAKEREVDNIRAIARGREAGLGPDEIEQELVIL